jgi:4-hydroxy-3-methylbut-2-enyl diphosphate reductase
VLSALRIEAMAVGGSVVVTGMGRDRAEAAARALAAGAAGAARSPGSPVAVTGVAGGLRPDLEPGDLVVADRLLLADGTAVRALPGAALLAAELRRSGLRVRIGPIVSSPTLARGTGARAALAATGALAVDMESAFIGPLIPDHPLAVVRAVADTERHGMVLGGARAVAGLRRVRPALEAWAASLGGRDVVLAAPRSFCAGVERAIEIVERAIARFGPPVYVRRQIVHNNHVVDRLRSMGAVFVQELAEVPDGAVVVLAAHGVSPEVRAEAARRTSLTVVDATCPLVAKVHHEARRYLAQEYRMVLIGHADHEEVTGTLGEAPGLIALVETVAGVDALDFDPGDRVAYLTQTTLATDETSLVVDALRARFPQVVGPHSDDICYATQNRQDAVRSLAQRCDLVLVVGSPTSSNAARLVEVARREGCRAELVEDESDVRLAWLRSAGSVGLTAGASTPELVVQRVLDALRHLGPVTVNELRTTEETVRFSLPQQVR